MSRKPCVGVREPSTPWTNPRYFVPRFEVPTKVCWLTIYGLCRCVDTFLSVSTRRFVYGGSRLWGPVS